MPNFTLINIYTMKYLQNHNDYDIEHFYFWSNK